MPVNAPMWTQHLQRALIVLLIIGFLYTTNYVILSSSPTWNTNPRGQMSIVTNHPIAKLVAQAQKEHEALLAKQPFDVKTAAANYRRVRGRHPPPGFDKWVQAALKSESPIVEEFFDRVYKDIAPYWALDADVLAQRSHAWEFRVRVRNGTATPVGKTPVNWVEDWHSGVEKFAMHLPDLDMPINNMDESRIILPYDKVDEYVAQELKMRKLIDNAKVTTEFKGRVELDKTTPEPYQPEWIGDAKHFWDTAVTGCSPTTPAYKLPFDMPEQAVMPTNYSPRYTQRGFVKNWTLATDMCEQPHLRYLHGSLIEPVSMKTTKELIPLFGGSKLTVNNEILLPGAKYLTEEPRYTSGSDHGSIWKAKVTQLVWRGVDSGGRTKAEDWFGFQRHRLNKMFNVTTVREMEQSGMQSKTFSMPPQSIYHNPRVESGQLSEWISKLSDTGFVELCGDCPFVHEEYHIVEKMNMADQFNRKFLPDVDGNSFSARFRTFLESTSLPIKATIYAEWHDDRLVPWLHFVPMDNTFQDIYNILDFFSDGDGPGDKAAEFIATSGKKWAETALRQQDMQLYMWRLLLEWARVCDPNRETLGYIDDLI